MILICVFLLKFVSKVLSTKQRENHINRGAKEHVYSAASGAESGEARKKANQFKDSRHHWGEHDAEAAANEA